MDAFKYYVNEWYKNRLNLPQIFYCQIHLTKRCQNNCVHCYFRELRESNLDFKEKELLEFLKRIRSCSKNLGLKPRIDFTGGDPLLYPHLTTAVKACMDLGLPYGFKCNPETILTGNKDIIDAIINSSGVNLSLDGLKPMHDRLRQSGSFDKTFRAINIIKELEVPLHINTTVSRINIDNLMPLINDLLSEGIIVDDYTWARYWSISHVEDILTSIELKQIFEEMTQFMISLFKKRDFYYVTKDNRVVPKILFGFKEHQWYPFLVNRGYINKEIQECVSNSKNCINCTATKHFYIVDPDLSVYKCRKLPNTKVNLLDFGTTRACDCNSLLAAECKKCKYYNGCGGCSAVSMCFIGNDNLSESVCPYVY